MAKAMTQDEIDAAIQKRRIGVVPPSPGAASLGLKSPITTPSITDIQTLPAHAAPDLPAYPGPTYVPARAATVTPGLMGSSTLVGETISRPFPSAAPAEQSTVPSRVGPMETPGITSIPAGPAAEAQPDRFFTGLRQPLAGFNREKPSVQDFAGGGAQITPNANYGRPVFAQTQGPDTTPSIITTADLPTASRSGFAQMTDADTIQAAEGRKAELTRELPGILDRLDDINMVRDASGRAAGIRATREVAARQAARGATSAKLADAQAKNVGSIQDAALKEAQIKKTIAETKSEERKAAGVRDFNRAEVQRNFLQTTKNPVLANIYTDWEERRATGTGQEIPSQSVSLYDPATFEPVTINLGGVVKKGQGGDVIRTIGLLTQAKEAFEKSGGGVFGVNMFRNKPAYVATLTALLNRLRSAGVIDPRLEA